MSELDAPQIVARIPESMWDVSYVAARYPGAADRGQLAGGANCQLFAYEVLVHFGFVIPDLRSEELWEDDGSTVRVSAPRPLDLILFNGTAAA